MAILIRGATILSLDAERGTDPFTGDILIEDDRISAVGSGPRERRRNGAGRAEPARHAGDHERPLPLVGELLQGPLRQPAARALDALLVPDPRPDADLRPAHLPPDDARGDRLPQARRHERARRRARDAGAEPRPARRRLPGLRGRRHPCELLRPHHQPDVHGHDSRTSATSCRRRSSTRSSRCPCPARTISSTSRRRRSSASTAARVACAT